MKPIPPVCYAVDGEKTSPKFARAFALGSGGEATNSSDLQPGPVALFGSPKRHALVEQARAEGRTIYYGDHGLFRRFEYYRVAKNQLQPQGDGKHASDRFLKLHWNLVPHWTMGGQAIVVCPNSPVYMEWFGIDARKWTVDIVDTLSKVSDRPVIVRWKAQAQKRPLYTDLHGAHMVVVFSSAAAIEALAAGIPVCTLAPWASTARMGIQDLTQVETPYYPSIQERDQFLFNLANQQWTLPEIEKGLAWKQIA